MTHLRTPPDEGLTVRAAMLDISMSNITGITS
jgi:hypothetical protein